MARIAASTLVCVRGEIACSFQVIEKIGDFPLENRTRAKCAQHVVERHTGVIVEGMSRRHLFGGERGELPHFDERRGRIIGVISLSQPAKLGEPGTMSLQKIEVAARPAHAERLAAFTLHSSYKDARTLSARISAVSINTAATQSRHPHDDTADQDR